MEQHPQTIINISTTDWNRIIDYLKEHKWKVKKQYWGFDKGIDYDFYHFQKEGQEIKMAWCNWFEGEMQAPAAIQAILSTSLALTFEYGTAEHL